MTCTRCEGTGFLNMHQVDKNTLEMFDKMGEVEIIFEWIRTHNDDVQVCDCCGDGENWYGDAGEHYNGEQFEGVYDYNGGLCECN